MKKAFWIIGSLLSSLMLGISFIQPEEKVFTPTEYYVGSQGEPDYRGIYMSHVGGSFAGLQKSDKTPKKLGSDDRVYAPKSPSGFQWFWAVPSASIKENHIKQRDIEVKTDSDDKVVFISEEMARLAKGQKSFLNDTRVTFKVPAGAKLVSPADSKLVPGSSNSEGIYPEANKTKGKYIQFIVNSGKTAYKVTYEDMLMWWSDMGKSDADDFKDGDKTKPVYGHTVAFSAGDSFSTGGIVGVAGNTGMPKAKRSKSDTYVTVSVEASPVEDGIITGEWSPISLGDFYKIGVNP